MALMKDQCPPKKLRFSDPKLHLYSTPLIDEPDSGPIDLSFKTNQLNPAKPIGPSFLDRLAVLVKDKIIKAEPFESVQTEPSKTEPIRAGANSAETTKPQKGKTLENSPSD